MDKWRGKAVLQLCSPTSNSSSFFYDPKNHWRKKGSVINTDPDANGTLKGDSLIPLSLSSKHFLNEQVQHLIRIARVSRMTWLTGAAAVPRQRMT
jgi:hypothetical protein